MDDKLPPEYTAKTRWPCSESEVPEWSIEHADRSFAHCRYIRGQAMAQIRLIDHFLSLIHI
eukprot:2704646-Alexandrium_andersonii.AAC.1